MGEQDVWNPVEVLGKVDEGGIPNLVAALSFRKIGHKSRLIEMKDLS